MKTEFRTFIQINKKYIKYTKIDNLSIPSIEISKKYILNKEEDGLLYSTEEYVDFPTLVNPFSLNFSNLKDNYFYYKDETDSIGLNMNFSKTYLNDRCGFVKEFIISKPIICDEIQIIPVDLVEKEIDVTFDESSMYNLFNIKVAEINDEFISDYKCAYNFAIKTLKYKDNNQLNENIIQVMLQYLNNKSWI